MQNMCELTIYVIGKASGQQQAISKVFGESKVICGFFDPRGAQCP